MESTSNNQVIDICKLLETGDNKTKDLIDSKIDEFKATHSRKEIQQATELMLDVGRESTPESIVVLDNMTQQVLVSIVTSKRKNGNIFNFEEYQNKDDLMK